MSILKLDFIANDFLSSEYINKPCSVNISLKQYLDKQEIVLPTEEKFNELLITVRERI